MENLDKINEEIKESRNPYFDLMDMFNSGKVERIDYVLCIY